MKRRLALFLAALLAALALTACGGSAGGGAKSEINTSGSTSAGESQMDFDGGGSRMSAAGDFGFDAPMDAAAPEEAPGEDVGAEDRLAGAKMVYAAGVEAETQDYDACTAALEKLVEDLGGYLEYASAGSYGDGSRRADYTVRIPSARFQSFLKSVGGISHVISQEQNADNISERYYDTESRLATQRTKLERLLALLAKAETMEDIIDLENAISETELQIEQLTGSLRHYDSLVDYATVELRIREVLHLTTVEEAPPTFASRLGNAFTGGLRSFGDFLQGLAVFLAYNWIWLLFLGLVLLAVVKLSKRAQVRRSETFRQARERSEGGFFKRKKDGPKSPDDKQP